LIGFEELRVPMQHQGRMAPLFVVERKTTFGWEICRSFLTLEKAESYASECYLFSPRNRGKMRVSQEILYL